MDERAQVAVVPADAVMTGLVAVVPADAVMAGLAAVIPADAVMAGLAAVIPADADREPDMNFRFPMPSIPLP